MVAAPPDLPPLKLAVPSVWDLLADVRARVENHLRGVDSDLREATVMVASELVENAIKYGSSKATLELAQDHGRLSVKLTSGVRSTAAALETVARVDAINRVSDKKALYFQRMRALAAESGSGSMQLGLVRICGEGEFELACRFERDSLQLTATKELT